jgi:hypothetical protein
MVVRSLSPIDDVIGNFNPCSREHAFDDGQTSKLQKYENMSISTILSYIKYPPPRAVFKIVLPRGCDDMT